MQQEGQWAQWEHTEHNEPRGAQGGQFDTIASHALCKFEREVQQIAMITCTLQTHHLLNLGTKQPREFPIPSEEKRDEGKDGRSGKKRSPTRSSRRYAYPQ